MNQILGYKYWNDWLCATRTELCQTLDKMTLEIGIDEPRWNLSWAQKEAIFCLLKICIEDQEDKRQQE